MQKAELGHIAVVTQRCCFRLLLLFSCLIMSDSFVTLSSPSSSSVCGISRGRRLEWVVIFFSRVSSTPRAWTCISCIAGRFCTAKPPGKHCYLRLAKGQLEQQELEAFPRIAASKVSMSLPSGIPQSESHVIYNHLVAHRLYSWI